MIDINIADDIRADAGMSDGRYTYQRRGYKGSKNAILRLASLDFTLDITIG
jgi:hypothetical protein